MATDRLAASSNQVVAAAPSSGGFIRVLYGNGQASAPADPIIGHPIIGSGENENYRVKRVSRPDFSTRYNGHLTVI